MSRTVYSTLTSRRAVVVMLGVSLLFQTAAIAAPGWRVLSDDFSSIKDGLFYYVTCSKGSDCETRSHIKDYADNENDVTRLQFCQGILRSEVGALVAWILTLITILILVCKKSLGHVWSILSSMMSVTAVIIGEILYVYLVWTRFYRDRYKASEVGFPYCILLDGLACALVIAAVIAMFIRHRSAMTAVEEREAGPSQATSNPAYAVDSKF